MIEYSMIDEKGYAKRQQEIDEAILKLLDDEGEGKTPTEIAAAVRALGVGNARSDDRLELSYSTTGAISRSAVNSLRARGLITDSWLRCNMQPTYQRPFRYFKEAR
jgi:hypothetical protein